MSNNSICHAVQNRQTFSTRASLTSQSPDRRPARTKNTLTEIFFERRRKSEIFGGKAACTIGSALQAPKINNSIYLSIYLSSRWQTRTHKLTIPSDKLQRMISCTTFHITLLSLFGIRIIFTLFIPRKYKHTNTHTQLHNETMLSH